MTTIGLADEAPNFNAQTTEGPIDFHQRLGEGWGYLVSRHTSELDQR